MEDEGSQVLMMRCISLMSSECRARDHTGGRTDSMCWQTRDMVGLGLESWWKELGLKLRQSFHESEDKAYGMEGSFWTLWQILSFLCKSNQRMMDFSNRNIPFCNIFFPQYISPTLRKRSRDIWDFLFYIWKYLFVQIITCKSGVHVYAWCVVGSQKSCAGERGSSGLSLCSWGLCHRKGHRQPLSPSPRALRECCKTHLHGW